MSGTSTMASLKRGLVGNLCDNIIHASGFRRPRYFCQPNAPRNKTQATRTPTKYHIACTARQSEILMPPPKIAVATVILHRCLWSFEFNHVALLARGEHDFRL